MNAIEDLNEAADKLQEVEQRLANVGPITKRYKQLENQLAIRVSGGKAL